MFENFKSDIIYYKTQADFELEFNFCGCYRKMRLLQDKCSDKKTLLLSLSRAVSRSRIIIITAPLFTEENIMGTIATAIGSGVETINNKEYKLNTNTEIEIIKSSIPLITSSGIFGGCIIESGPQSLILLTDNKDVRKTIMQELIHPYVKEFTDSAKKEDEVNINQNDETVTPEAEEEIEAEKTTETEKIIEPTEEQVDPANELIIETEELLAPEEFEDETDEYFKPQEIDLYTEEEIPDLISSSEEHPEDNFYEDTSDYFTEETEPETSPLNTVALIISVVLLVLIAVLCFCIFFIPTKAGIAPADYIKDIFNTMFR